MGLLIKTPVTPSVVSGASRDMAVRCVYIIVLVSVLLFIESEASVRNKVPVTNFGQSPTDGSKIGRTPPTARIVTDEKTSSAPEITRRQRALLQRRASERRDEVECTLSQSQTRRYLDDAARIWNIDDAALEDLENDIQAVVDCTEEGDTVLFDVSGRIRPANRIVIPWRLSISARTENTELEDGLFPRARPKTAFRCPRRNQGIFLLQYTRHAHLIKQKLLFRTRDVLFANLIFERCDLEAASNETIGIIENESCRSGRVTGSIQMHHISFRNNALNNSVGLLIDAPSCSSVELIDVEFINSNCQGLFCGASLAGESTLRDVTISGNILNAIVDSTSVLSLLLSPIASASNIPAVVRVREGSVTVERATSTTNFGLAFLVEEGALDISNLNCFDNTGESFRGSCCIVLINSTATIHDSQFADNTGGSGAALHATAQSNITMTDTVMFRNNATSGGAIFLEDRGSLTLDNCTLVQNGASSSGGAIFTSNSTLIAENLNCTSNAAPVYGGCINSERSSFVEMTECSFTQNSADFGGASHFDTFPTAIFTNCLFTRNSAGTSGAASFLENTTATFDLCVFSQNRASYGGAIYVLNSSLVVDDSRFDQNSVTNRGGAINSVLNSTVILRNTTFTANRADGIIFVSDEDAFGGALFLERTEAEIDSVFFLNNTADQTGGGVYAWLFCDIQISHSAFFLNAAEYGGGFGCNDNVTIRITSSSFLENSAVQGGGGAYFDQSNATVELSTFFGSNSSYGSGLYGVKADIEIDSCSFQNGTATSSGAGFYGYQNSSLLVRNSVLENGNAEDYAGGLGLNVSSAYISNTTFSSNHGGLNAGGLYAWEAETVLITDSLFVNNSASFGGALEFEFGASGAVVDSQFIDNTGSIGGGIAYVEESDLVMEDCHFTGNHADFGGDFYLFDGRLSIADTQSENDTGITAGGFIYGSTGSFAVLRNVSILESSAALGGGISLHSSYLWASNTSMVRCNGTVQGGAIFANASSSVMCDDCLFENNRAAEEGGGVSLVSQKSQLLAFQFDNCRFVNNRAETGGAFQCAVDAVYGDAECAMHNASCTFLALSGTEFTGNRATWSGGAIFVNEGNAVRIRCTPRPNSGALTYFTRRQFVNLPTLTSLNVTCPSWEDNSARQHGEIVGTYPELMRKWVFDEQANETIEIMGQRYIVHDHQSGFPIPDISIELLDAFGQGPVSALHNQTINATMWSPDRLFCCPEVVEMRDGRANFSGVYGFTPTGVYEVRIDFSDDRLLSLVLLVEIRGCSIGQVVTANGTFCQPCSDSTYNFLPQQAQPGCVPCPDDGICDNRAIRPENGYWHQTPCSRHIQECLTERACDQPGRDEGLQIFGANLNSCNFSEELIRTYMDAQCREGYDGPLCGSCADSYGRSRALRCEECFDGFSNFVLVLLSALVLLGLSGFAIRSNLVTLRVNASDKAISPIASRRHLPQEALDGITPTHGQLELMEMYAHGIVPKEPPKKETVDDKSEELQLKRMELAKWKAVEIFKITINFLQVIAVAISLNVNWTDALIAMFETAEFIGGVTSEAATRSVDCIITNDSSIARSAVRTVVSILVPSLVFFFYAVFWGFAMLRFAETLSYILKRCLLSFMAIAYITYIAITKTVVNVHYCVDVYDSFDFQSNHTTQYWAVDTSLKCYEGSHTVLAALIGWPVMILFSFGFPVAIAYTLISERSRHNMKSEWLFETAGFMYRSYRERYVFWEAVIMLRKAVLAVVVVFSYPLGGNLQGVIAVFVLIIALYFQIICRPFRAEFEGLNEIEGLSLLVSSLTFVSGLFFNDDRASDAVRILLTAFVTICNFGLFFFLLFTFFRCSAVYLRQVLTVEGVRFHQHRGSFHILSVYFHSRLGRFFAIISDCFLKNPRSRRDARVSA